MRAPIVYDIVPAFGQDIAWDRRDISNLIGAISLAFWLCNGVPLVYEIYKRKSADGLSLGFVGLWTVGDILNLAGSIWAHLVPTTIVVGIYYILSDVVILCEVSYYRGLARLKGDDTDDEETPLIVAPNDLFLAAAPRNTALQEIIYDAGACSLVTILGVAGWYLSMTLFRTHDKNLYPPEQGDSLTIGPQILGYTSAMLYLCARIPQIMKNHAKKRTDGLAPLFFIFSVFGNVTYATSIVIFSTDSEYLITNIPWLLGSLGTLAFDFIILAQFLIYRHREEEVEVEVERSLLNT